jgi:hypothetical protein
MINYSRNYYVAEEEVDRILGGKPDGICVTVARNRLGKFGIDVLPEKYEFCYSVGCICIMCKTRAKAQSGVGVQSPPPILPKSLSDTQKPVAEGRGHRHKVDTHFQMGFLEIVLWNLWLAGLWWHLLKGSIKTNVFSNGLQKVQPAQKILVSL